MNTIENELTCNGWHGGVGMFYARAHYSHTREWDKYDAVALCPVHGSVAP